LKIEFILKYNYFAILPALFSKKKFLFKIFSIQTEPRKLFLTKFVWNRGFSVFHRLFSTFISFFFKIMHALF
jgi:hypothetical protein